LPVVQETRDSALAVVLASAKMDGSDTKQKNSWSRTYQSGLGVYRQ
jgi:hypothetical protein